MDGALYSPVIIPLTYIKHTIQHIMDPLTACWTSLDTLRWYIYHWRARPRETWQQAITRFFHTLQSEDIDLQITDDTLNIFRGDDPRPVQNAPKYVKRLHGFLKSKPHRFRTVRKDPTRKTIHYKGYKRGVGRIDRAAWAEWACYGFYTLAPNKQYAVTDLLQVGLHRCTFRHRHPYRRPPPHPLKHIFNTRSRYQWTPGTAAVSSSGSSSSRGRSLSVDTGRDIYGRHASTLTRGIDSHHTLVIFHINTCQPSGGVNSYYPLSPSSLPYKPPPHSSHSTDASSYQDCGGCSSSN